MLSSLAFLGSYLKLNSLSQGRHKLSVSEIRRTLLCPTTGPCKGAPGRALCMSLGRGRRSQNVDGDVYVDTSCIDCDTCRWIAPKTFRHELGQSAVYRQPEGPQDRSLALAAAVACPTGSIRTESRTTEMKDVQKVFPMPMNHDGSVFYLGFTSPDTFAASSWLCITPAANIMIDIPRFNSGLAKRIEQVIEEKGRPGSGLDYIILSHSDDVAGHAKWAERFPNTPRMIHRAECNKWQGADACEIKLALGEDGEESRLKLTDDIEVIHVPGHTWGSIAVLDRRSQSLFTGDHLFFSPKIGRLFGSTRFVSYSWREVQRSTTKLLEEPFLHIYPGHGRAHHFLDANDRRATLKETVEQMKKARARVP